MASSILSIVFPIVTLLLLSAIRYKLHHALLCGITIGLCVLHAAHHLLYKDASLPPEQIALTDSAFHIMYLTSTYLSIRKYFFTIKRTMFFGLVFLAGCTALSLYIFSNFSISMTLYNYSFLIWAILTSINFVIWLRFTSLTIFTESRFSRDRMILSTLAYVLSSIFAIPFMLSAIVAFMPQDNFIAAYRPLISLRETIIVLQMVGWAICVLHLFVWRKVLSSKSQSKLAGAI